VYAYVDVQDASGALAVPWSWGDGTESVVPVGKQLKLFDIVLYSEQPSYGTPSVSVYDGQGELIYRVGSMKITHTRLQFKPPIKIPSGGYVEIGNYWELNGYGKQSSFRGKLRDVAVQ